MMISNIKILLDFLQAIAWPLVTIVFFLYFAPLLKTILLSVNKAVSQRGIKVTKAGVEIPGPPQQEKVETIQDLILQQWEWGELSKQHKTEKVQEPLMLQPQTSEQVLEHHGKNLLTEIRSSLEKFLQEKTTEDPGSMRDVWLQDLLCDAYICLYFERCFQRILGSQLDLLRHLVQEERHQLSEEDVFKIFYTHYPNLPPPTFQKWLNYLESLKFIHIMGTSIVITKEGKEFLRYIHERGYSLNKPG